MTMTQTPYREKHVDPEPPPTTTLSDTEAFRMGFKKLMWRWAQLLFFVVLSPLITLFCMLVDAGRYTYIAAIKLGHQEAGIESEREFETSIRHILETFNAGLGRDKNSKRDPVFPWFVIAAIGACFEAVTIGAALHTHAESAPGMGAVVGFILPILMFIYMFFIFSPEKSD